MTDGKDLHVSRMKSSSDWRSRDPCEYESLLLAGLNYPWHEVVWNARDALEMLFDERFVPQLVQMFDEPSTTEPYQDEDGRWRLRELVAVQHLSNCLLCHPPATRPAGLLRSLIPDPSQQLVLYCDSPQLQGDLVRADVTYLRQHFSLIQEVEDHDAWPKFQRVDYLIRERSVLAADRGLIASRKAQGTIPTAPHRDAISYLLESKTGKTVAALRTDRTFSVVDAKERGEESPGRSRVALGYSTSGIPSSAAR